MLLVRTAFDPNWRATVDGRPAPILPADSVVQAVQVPAGRHVVALAYDDPSVGHGLLGTGLVLALLLLAWAVRTSGDPPSNGPATGPEPED
jgi:uncharacterized membrane protein YfhO